jgi:hypothetical protein
MAFSFQKTDSPDIEQLLRQDYQSLSEKDRRRFAALEAITRGHGGTRDIATVLACDPQTVRDGLRERKPRPEDPAGSRVRKPGGGRQKTAGTPADWLQQVHHTINDRTAGAPLRQAVVWTDLTPQEISHSLQKPALCAGPRLGRRSLAGLGLARRPRRKGLPGGDSPHRGEQFRHRAHLLQALLEAGHPVWSIETTKKADVGTLCRDGTVSCPQALQAFAHDFPSLAAGVLMPHGLYDLARKQGGMHVGLSRAPTACACDSLRLFWYHEGQRLSPTASARVLRCDGGGRNSGHTHRFKEDRQGVANDLGVPIRVAPSPAYGSTCTPSARRLFRHVPRACQGVLFDSLHTVMGLIHKTKTHQGLSVTVRVLDPLDAGGRTVTEAFKKHMPIVFAKLLPTWNYWALPQ